MGAWDTEVPVFAERLGRVSSSASHLQVRLGAACSGQEWKSTGGQTGWGEVRGAVGGTEQRLEEVTGIHEKGREWTLSMPTECQTLVL